MFVEIRLLGFHLTFPTNPKTRRSDIGSSRYREKTPKNDLQQSIRSTNFENLLRKRCYSDRVVEIRFVGFHLTFPTTSKTRHFDIDSSRYRKKIPKNDLQLLV